MVEHNANKERFIQRCIEKYGDQDDYSKVNYINIDTKIEIVCKKHGSFWVVPYTYLKGATCKYCKQEKRSEENLIKFIERVTEVNKYFKSGEIEYVEGFINLAEYCVFKSKYGLHRIIPYQLIMHPDTYPNSITALDKQAFFVNFLKEKNDYFKDNRFSIEGTVESFKSWVKVKADNKEKMMVYGSLLSNRMPQFERTRKVKEKVKQDFTKNFIEKCQEQRKDFDKIDYSLTKVLPGVKTSLFRCKEHDIIYKQRRDGHLNGYQGCTMCAKIASGLYTQEYFTNEHENTLSTLYCIKISNDEELFYKIGITKVNVNKRFSEIKKNYNVEVLYLKEDYIANNFREEQHWIETFSQYKYKPKIKFSGWTECFSENIYDLIDHVLGCEHEYKIENDLRETGLTLEEYYNPYFL